VCVYGVCFPTFLIFELELIAVSLCSTSSTVALRVHKKYISD
jgi:hypothetical protein